MGEWTPMQCHSLIPFVMACCLICIFVLTGFVLNRAVAGCCKETTHAWTETTRSSQDSRSVASTITCLWAPVLPYVTGDDSKDSMAPYQGDISSHPSNFPSLPRLLPEGWYRFSSPAGNLRVAGGKHSHLDGRNHE